MTTVEQRGKEKRVTYCRATPRIYDVYFPFQSGAACRVPQIPQKAPAVRTLIPGRHLCATPDTADCRYYIWVGYYSPVRDFFNKMYSITVTCLSMTAKLSHTLLSCIICFCVILRSYTILILNKPPPWH